MVSDQEIAEAVETLLRQSDPGSFTSLNGVVQQLEAKLGLDLAHKSGFIRDQMTFLLRSHPLPKDHFPPQPQPHFPNSPQPQQILHPHFVLQQQPHLFHHQHNSSPPPPRPPQVQHRQPQPLPKGGADARNSLASASEMPKGSTPTGTKRRGGPGGLSKVCGVSPELQTIVGEPALSRTEIVKQLWAYIRKHNLQDPGNKRKIICNDALRLVFETDCTDMFKMNKLLAKHIIPLDPMKEFGQAKKLKVDEESPKESTEHGSLSVLLSNKLANFFGTGEREMLQSEALRRVWNYIKVNQLEDPLNSSVILCDAKLRDVLGCESISSLGMQEILARQHLFKQ
ncbi:SWIB complex BAF60b domain-containing protein [Abeliophyllum distichum]|uniref:SWIB complex BAF60b domain-containing protein n=1 Tax=Abeliophyllum distichum TaxID=126358 RepID=A0ABD1UGH4_9LAMI